MTRRGRPLLVAAALTVCALVALPVVYLVVRAAEGDASSWDLIIRFRTVALAGRTLGLAAAVTVTTVGIGVPLAWLVTRSDLPLRRLWSVLLALPLVIPSYVGAFALISALGPRGMLQQVLEGPFGVQRLPDIAGFPGAYLALSLFTYPYVYLLAAAAIRGLDPSVEEAARSLGFTRWHVFRRVTMPLLRPSIAAGGLLVALYALHDFGAVSLMRYTTFTQAIFLQYRGAFDRTPAAILSLILVALALIVLGLERRARGRARFHRTGAGAPRPVPRSALGRWTWPAVALVVAVVLLAFVLPVSVIAFWLGRAVARGAQFEPVAGAAAASATVSVSGAVAALVAAAPVAVLSAWYPGRLAGVTERLAYTAYALPGLVVALAFVFFGANFAPWIYQSIPLLVLAYVVLYLPQAHEPIRAALLQVGPRLEEAGRTLGRSRAHVIRRVVAPLVSRGALAGFAVVFLTAMKELPATLLLRPTGFETLATRIWTEASGGRFGEAALPALLLLVVSAIPLYALASRIAVQEVRSE